MLIEAKKLIGLPVFTQSGQKLGEVDDLEIEIDGQSIMNYQVGGSGVIKGLLGSKLIVHRSQILSITEDKVVVEDNVADKKEAIAEDKEEKSSSRVSEGVVTSSDNN